MIKGLDKHKERVTFIVAESSVVRRHLDTYQFSDLVSELHAKNFYFLNVMNPLRPTARFYDTIFVQKEDPRLETAVHKSTTSRSATVPRGDWFCRGDPRHIRTSRQASIWEASRQGGRLAVARHRALGRAARPGQGCGHSAPATSSCTAKEDADSSPCRTSRPGRPGRGPVGPGDAVDRDLHPAGNCVVVAEVVADVGHGQ